MKEYIVLSQEVKAAKEQGLPIVALESTIISHGMPYPQNVQTAREVEQIVRDNGAVPATIALIDGKIKIGLSDEELEMFGDAKDVAKVSRRDIGYIIASKKLGATTVAATMICAAMADIKFFVTGGIGGVHRGAETTMDISADLEELATTDVAVICAGAKSILDLNLTMEYLETKGVPVLGYKTDVLPSFFNNKSNIHLEYNMDDTKMIAQTMKAKWDLHLHGGAVIANPIPDEWSMDEDFINGAIEKALLDAASQGISGKDSTPFLLGAIKEATGGKSLESNIALVKNNAVVGAKIAVDFNKLG
ncbi:MAG: pseudouridine-5'-phosphate glycosidase [Streptococcaceae bacterium]|jgi:pseudouridine-5'-phosphate glycosidase|nr:pseudouridine-5'-phosphate glycosidase [Streptococcaceae bacterium]